MRLNLLDKLRMMKKQLCCNPLRASQSVASPSPHEFTGAKVGTSLASTARGVWEQTGMDRFPVQPGGGLENSDSLEALVRAILD